MQCQLSIKPLNNSLSKEFGNLTLILRKAFLTRVRNKDKSPDDENPQDKTL